MLKKSNFGPGTLFNVVPVLSFRRPQWTPTETSDLLMRQSFGLNGTGYDHMVIHRADVLRYFAGRILDEFQGQFFRFWEGLWPTQCKPLTALLQSFFRPMGNGPAALFSHGLVWNDRAVEKIFFEGRRIRESTDRQELFEIGYPSQLYFEDKAHPVEVDQDLQWTQPSFPAGGLYAARSEDGKLVRITEEQTSFGNGRQSSHYRQQLGVANITDSVQQAIVDFGTHPAALSRTRSMIKLANGDLSTVHIGSICPPGSKLVESVGVMDAIVLRLWRLKKPIRDYAETVSIEELAITFERNSGRVLYVAASTDKLERLPHIVDGKRQEFRETNVGYWIEQRLMGKKLK